MAVDAADRVGHLLPRFGVGHLIEALEAFEEIPAPERPVGHVQGRVTVQARARLLGDHLPLGVGLILQHVGVTPLFAEVFCERVTGPERLQPRILFQP